MSTCQSSESDRACVRTWSHSWRSSAVQRGSTWSKMSRRERPVTRVVQTFGNVLRYSLSGPPGRAKAPGVAGRGHATGARAYRRRRLEHDCMDHPILHETAFPGARRRTPAGACLEQCARMQHICARLGRRGHLLTCWMASTTSSCVSAALGLSKASTTSCCREQKGVMCELMERALCRPPAYAWRIARTHPVRGTMHLRRGAVQPGGNATADTSPHTHARTRDHTCHTAVQHARCRQAATGRMRTKAGRQARHASGGCEGPCRPCHTHMTRPVPPPRPHRCLVLVAEILGHEAHAHALVAVPGPRGGSVGRAVAQWVVQVAQDGRLGRMGGQGGGNVQMSCHGGSVGSVAAGGLGGPPYSKRPGCGPTYRVVRLGSSSCKTRAHMQPRRSMPQAGSAPSPLIQWLRSR